MVYFISDDFCRIVLLSSLPKGGCLSVFCHTGKGYRRVGMSEMERMNCDGVKWVKCWMNEWKGRRDGHWKDESLHNYDSFCLNFCYLKFWSFFLFSRCVYVIDRFTEYTSVLCADERCFLSSISGQEQRVTQKHKISVDSGVESWRIKDTGKVYLSVSFAIVVLIFILR